MTIDVQMILQRARRELDQHHFDRAEALLEPQAELHEQAAELLQQVRARRRSTVERLVGLAARALEEDNIRRARRHLKDLRACTKVFGVEVLELEERIAEAEMVVRQREDQAELLKQGELVLLEPTYHKVRSLLGTLAGVSFLPEHQAQVDELKRRLSTFKDLTTRLTAIATTLELLDDVDSELEWVEEQESLLGPDYVEPVSGKTVREIHALLVNKARESYHRKIGEWGGSIDLCLESFDERGAQTNLDKMEQLRQGLLTPEDLEKVSAARRKIEAWSKQHLGGLRALDSCREALGEQRWADALEAALEACDRVPDHPEVPVLRGSATRRLINAEISPAVLGCDKAHAALYEARQPSVARERTPPLEVAHGLQGIARLIQRSAACGDETAESYLEQAVRLPGRITELHAVLDAVMSIEPRYRTLVEEGGAGAGSLTEVGALIDEIEAARAASPGFPGWVLEQALQRRRLLESAQSRSTAVEAAQQALRHGAIEEAYQHLQPHQGQLGGNAEKGLWFRLLWERGQRLLRQVGYEAAEATLRQAREAALDERQMQDIDDFLRRVGHAHHEADEALRLAAEHVDNDDFAEAFAVLDGLVGEQGTLDQRYCPADSFKRLREQRRDHGLRHAKRLHDAVDAQLAVGESAAARETLKLLRGLPAFLVEQDRLRWQLVGAAVQHAHDLLRDGEVLEARGVLLDVRGRDPTGTRTREVWAQVDEALCARAVPAMLGQGETKAAGRVLDGLQYRENVPQEELARLWERVAAIESALLRLDVDEGQPERAFRTLCRPGSLHEPEAARWLEEWFRGWGRDSLRAFRGEGTSLEATLRSLPLVFYEARGAVRSRAMVAALGRVRELLERELEVCEDIEEGITTGLDRLDEKQRQVQGNVMLAEDVLYAIGEPGGTAGALRELQRRAQEVTTKVRGHLRLLKRLRSLCREARRTGLFDRARGELRKALEAPSLEHHPEIRSLERQLELDWSDWIEVTALMGAKDPPRPARTVLQEGLDPHGRAAKRRHTIQERFSSGNFLDETSLCDDLMADLDYVEHRCGDRLRIDGFALFGGPNGERVEGVEAVREQAKAMWDLVQRRRVHAERFFLRKDAHWRLGLWVAAAVARADLGGLEEVSALLPGTNGRPSDADVLLPGPDPECWPALPSEEELRAVESPLSASQQASDQATENLRQLSKARDDLLDLWMAIAQGRKRIEDAFTATAGLRAMIDALERAHGDDEITRALLDLVVLAPANPVLLGWLERRVLERELSFVGDLGLQFEGDLVHRLSKELDNQDRGALFGADLGRFFTAMTPLLEQARGVAPRAGAEAPWEELRATYADALEGFPL